MINIVAVSHDSAVLLTYDLKHHDLDEYFSCNKN
jgi:hypothetical protein